MTNPELVERFGLGKYSLESVDGMAVYFSDRELDELAKGHLQVVPIELLKDKVAADSVSHPPRAHESGWLIEKANLGLCLGVCGQRFSWVVFTNDDAIRFARKRDAEAVLNALTFESLLGKEFGGVVITEHIWG